MNTVKVRIQVSIHPGLVEIAQRNMLVRQYSSFSAYLETLIREEHERRIAAEQLTRQTTNAPQPIALRPDVNSGAHLAGAMLNDALAVHGAKQEVQPVSYAAERKTARQTKPGRAPVGSKKKKS